MLSAEGGSSSGTRPCCDLCMVATSFIGPGCVRASVKLAVPFLLHRVVVMTKVEADVITPQERIIAIQREPYSRKHNGELVQWFVADKHGKVLLSGGKLSALQNYINAHTEAPHDRVHLSGLFESMERMGGRTGGWYLNRWMVSTTPLSDAAAVLEKLRSEYERVVMVAPPGVYTKVALA